MLGAVLGIIVISATFSRVFSDVLLSFGCCFRDFCSFSYFLPGLFRMFFWVLGAVLRISAVSATFSRILSWVLGAVLGISAVSATFSQIFSGF